MFINSYDVLEITGFIFRDSEHVSSMYFTWRCVCSANSPGNQNPVTLHDINGQIFSLQMSYRFVSAKTMSLMLCFWVLQPLRLQ